MHTGNIFPGDLEEIGVSFGPDSFFNLRFYFMLFCWGGQRGPMGAWQALLLQLKVVPACLALLRACDVVEHPTQMYVLGS